MLLSAESRRSLSHAWYRGRAMLRSDRSWGSTLGSLACATLLVQLFVVGLMTMNGMCTAVLAKTGIQVDIASGARDQDVQELFAALNEFPAVIAVNYVPTEKTYGQQGDHFSLQLPSMAAFEELVAFLAQPHWQAVLAPSFFASLGAQQHAISEAMTVMGLSLTAMTIILIVGLLTTLAFLVQAVRNRMQMRRQELELQSVLGAQEMQVLLPLMLESMVLLGGALILGTAGAAFVLLLLPALLPALQLSGIPFVALFEVLLMPLLCAGVIIVCAKMQNLWPKPLAS